MSSGSGSFAFDTASDDNCWHGEITSFESALLQKFPFRNLELMRNRFFQTVTSPPTANTSVRSVVQMAFDTEIGVVLGRLVVLAEEIFTSRVCERRKYIDIDTDMAPYGFLVEAAQEELEQDQKIPLPYLQLYRQHLASKYPRYRVCGQSALLCIAAYYYLGAGA